MNFENLEDVVTYEKYLDLIKKYNALELRLNVYVCVIAVISVVLIIILAFLFFDWVLKKW